jgi:hypothetical protein
MKFSTILISACMASACDAFSVSKSLKDFTKAATAVATSLTVASSIAMASPVDTMDFHKSSMESMIVSNSVILSDADPFAMPKYEEASQNKSLDLKLELTNKATLDKAAAKREDKNIEKENNQRFQDLKRLEAEEDARLLRMKKYAEEERLQKIEREKAEIRANKWNTF